jgi:hypothetical protein
VSVETPITVAPSSVSLASCAARSASSVGHYEGEIRGVKNQNRPFAVSLEIGQTNLTELARAGLERFHFEFRHGIAHAYWQHFVVDCFV